MVLLRAQNGRECGSCLFYERIYVVREQIPFVFIDRRRQILYAHHLLTLGYFHFVFGVLTVVHNVWIVDELLIHVKVN